MSAAFAAFRIEPARPRWMRVLGCLALAAALLLAPGARSQDVEMLSLAAARGEHGIELDFAVRVVLPPAVEDALRRGIPLHFVARATVVRPRWYWRDERIARASRAWRLSYQPLTAAWRVSQGGLHQSYDSLSDALLAVSRGARWQVADASQVDPDERYEIQFTWKLDTAQLPRPMQIGIGTQAEWNLGVERTLRLDRSVP